MAAPQNIASGGTGSIPYTYFIVANDTTTNVQTSPMQIMSWLSTGTDSIPVRWPRVANGAVGITYDVIRIATPATVGSVFPYNGGCPGGAGWDMRICGKRTDTGCGVLGWVCLHLYR